MTDKSEASELNILHLKKLNIHIESRPLLERIDLKVVRGELSLITGDNGAGKSMLLNAINFALPSSATSNIDDCGTFFGKKLSEPRTKCHFLDNLVYIRQKKSLFETLTVIQNLQLYLTRSNVYTAASARREAHWLCSRHFEDTSIGSVVANNLSGGQKRMVSLVCAVAAKPIMLALDEPLAGLSTKSAQKCIKIMGELRSLGCGLLVVEHRSTELREHADRIYKISDNRLICSYPHQNPIH